MRQSPIRTWGAGALQFTAAAIFGASAVALAAHAQSGAPATQHPSFAGHYRIAGTVVNAISGDPIRHASVAALSEADSQTVASVLSDGEGRFSISGLAAAKFQLTVSKRGFRTAFYDEHEEYSTAIVTGDGQDPGHLVFRLTPSAVLRGTVTGDGGDPVDGANVLLFLRPKGNKLNARIEEADSTRTDDNGEYEFGNLPAGDYFVAVTAEPWYSLHRSSGAREAKLAEPGSSALDVAYPVTFFDSTTDEASATPIPVAAGTTEQANISLHASPALHLFVQTPRRPDGSVARPELRQSVFGTQISAESMGNPLDSARSGAVEFTGVAPGHYELAQGDPPRIVELDAAASQQVDPAVGTPTVDVAGTLKNASGAPLPSENLVVALEPLDGERRRETMQTGAPRGSFHFAAVPPGRWTLSAQNGGSALPVLSTTVGNRTHGGNQIVVSDRPLQIAVTVSQGEIRVEGFARKDGKGFAGAMVVLVPKSLAACRELARRDQSDSDGSFSLRNAAPGQYTVVAIQDGWGLDWSRPEVISRFLPRGIPVSVADTPAKSMNLAAEVPVQSP